MTTAPIDSVSTETADAVGIRSSALFGLFRNRQPANIISLGAGVQSSVMLLQAARGDFQDLDGQLTTVDAAIFSDTQAEPQSVMKWLDYLEEQVKKEAYPFPVFRVTAGSLERDEMRIRTSSKSGKKYMKGSIPAFVLNPDGTKGLLGRKCTSDYKIIPLQRKVRELVGIKRAGAGIVRAKMWIGITTDEAHRMKPSRVDYIENTWPLIDAGMSRKDCLRWMRENGYPEPPRSACYFCPFHGDHEWRRLRDEEPQEFARAIAFDQMLRNTQAQQEVLRGIPFLHSSCEPLGQVNFDQRPSHEQLNLFGNECEGLCGV
jgi:hypothetical protein